MSQGNDVTYADLSFGKTPPEKALHEEPNEGELTYENVWGPRAKEEEEEEEEEEVAAPGRGKEARGWKRWTRRTALGTVATGLFLLATTVGLGVQYWQASGQLQRASQGHTAHSTALSQRIAAQEEILGWTQGQLRQAKGELSSTRAALRKSQEATEQTQQQLQGVEEALREANRSLETLKWENEEKEAELRQATSCQQVGCCPSGWKLFRWKCFWISTQKEYWLTSLEDCQRMASLLAVLKEPWEARAFWDTVISRNALQDSEYWIGLNCTWSKEKKTLVPLWADGSHYERTQPSTKYSYYGVLHGFPTVQVSHRYRYIEPSWDNKCRYICEVAASSVALVDPN